MSEETRGFDKTGERLRILPILVLYNRKLDESETYRSFVSSSRAAKLGTELIAVYDNSPHRHVSPAEEAHLFAYKHDAENSGLAAAYNWGLGIAKAHGFCWLLLLDQDTDLPLNFIEACNDAAREYEACLGVSAIVPKVLCGEKVVSPNHVERYRLGPVSQATPGILSEEITAINSGVVVRCNFVEGIGGFNRDYRLDFLDHWMFHQLHLSGRQVALSNLTIQHNLSVENYRDHVSTERYRSILAAETAFVTAYRSRFQLLIYLFRLLARCVKLTLVTRKPRLAAITLWAVARTALHSGHGHGRSG